MNRGKFITVEGGEGAGKSTQVAAIRDVCTAAGKKVRLTREPGGSKMAESIRDLLLSPKSEFAPGGMTELLMMFAARAEHLAQLIRPALEAGEWVICDRFTDASYAYQGGGRGIDADRILALENLVQAGLQPDLTVLLDMPIDVGMDRIAARGTLDRFEQEAPEFYERVRSAYLERAKMFPERIKVIDASGTITEVEKQVKRVVEALIEATDES